MIGIRRLGGGRVMSNLCYQLVASGAVPKLGYYTVADPGGCQIFPLSTGSSCSGSPDYCLQTHSKNNS